METCATARVVRDLGARAEVVVDREEACASCSSADICHSLGGRTSMRFEVDNPLRAREGQQVEIAANRSLGLRAAFMVYLFPAMFFVSGVVIGSEALRWRPWASGLLGLGMLGIAWFLAWLYDRHARTNRQFRLVISRIVK